MTTDFRALCAELAHELDAETGYTRSDGRRIVNPAVVRARTALAEPETKEPTDADLHAMAFRFAQPCFDFEYIPFARAVLARWGRSDGPAVPDGREPASVASEPSDAGPAVGEVVELVAWLREQGQNRDALSLPGVKLLGQLRTAPFMLTRAADLLERLSPPQPVPVSERWPEHGDVGPDGAIWFRKTDKEGETHWLPRDALPLPE